MKEGGESHYMTIRTIDSEIPQGCARRSLYFDIGALEEE